MIEFLPSIDSDEIAETRRGELSIPRHIAQALASSAVVAIRAGSYFDDARNIVDWSKDVRSAVASKVSIRPKEQLPRPQTRYAKTTVLVTNETTLGAAKRLFESGKNPIVLNFANGVQPGGDFLSGVLAQ